MERRGRCVTYKAGVGLTSQLGVKGEVLGQDYEVGGEGQMFRRAHIQVNSCKTNPR